MRESDSTERGESSQTFRRKWNLRSNLMGETEPLVGERGRSTSEEMDRMSEAVSSLVCPRNSVRAKQKD